MLPQDTPPLARTSPLRQCIFCRQLVPRESLHRLVASTTLPTRFVVNPVTHVPGRSAYWCREITRCVGRPQVASELLPKGILKAFGRALKTPLAGDIITQLLPLL